MIINDKSDILSDILRSFHNDILVRCQGSNNLNELAVQHPGKGCRPSQNVQMSNPTKNAKICGLEKKRKILTSKPVTDTVVVLSNQCIPYGNKRDKLSL